MSVETNKSEPLFGSVSDNPNDTMPPGAIDKLAKALSGQSTTTQSVTHTQHITIQMPWILVLIAFVAGLLIGKLVN